MFLCRLFVLWIIIHGNCSLTCELKPSSCHTSILAISLAPGGYTFAQVRNPKARPFCLLAVRAHGVKPWLRFDPGHTRRKRVSVLKVSALNLGDLGGLGFKV